MPRITERNPSVNSKPENQPATPAPAPAPAPDPFDPATYRVPMSLEAAAGVKQILTSLTVRTPDKSWWVRRHPRPDYAMKAWVIELKEERETYLVTPKLWPALAGEATFKPKLFYLATNRQGHLCLWAVRCPADDTVEPDRWMRAPLEAVRLAKEKWVRITWTTPPSRTSGCGRRLLAELGVRADQFESPEWP